MKAHKNQPKIITALLAITLQFVSYGKEPAREPMDPVPEGAFVELNFVVKEPGGKLIEDAKVKAGFYLPRPVKGFPTSEGTTDERGRFVAKGKTRDEVRYWITKDGYYKSTGTYNCPRASRNEYPRIKNGYWQPRKPTVSVELRPIRNPIPMYVKKASTGVPEADETLGYDLLKG